MATAPQLEEDVIPGGTGIVVETEAEHKVFPPFDSTTFASQLVWLAITFAVLYWLMAKVAIPRIAGILAARQGRVAGDIGAAEQAKANSEAARLGNEKALADARAYEVETQTVMTSHLIGYDLLVVSKALWDAMSADEQAAFQTAADEAMAWSAEQHLAREAELVEFFKGEGMEIYTPDVDAFRAYAQTKYLESDLSKAWPEGMLDRINAL
jgi:hypothetical protein